MDKTYFEEMKNKIREFREKMKKEGSDFFKEQAKILFEENPSLIKFGWNQYTPYFNDGDACVFSANTEYPFTLNKDEDDDWMEEERYFKDNDQTEYAKNYKNVIGFLGQFSDDDLEIIFGDHCRVIVSRESIEVEEYDHD